MGPILPLQVVFAWVSFYRKCRELGVFGASTLQYPRERLHPIEAQAAYLFRDGEQLAPEWRATLQQMNSGDCYISAGVLAFLLARMGYQAYVCSNTSHAFVELSGVAETRDEPLYLDSAGTYRDSKDLMGQDSDPVQRLYGGTAAEIRQGMLDHEGPDHLGLAVVSAFCASLGVCLDVPDFEVDTKDDHLWVNQVKGALPFVRHLFDRSQYRREDELSELGRYVTNIRQALEEHK